MRVITKFQSAYDKYLFEGIINPEDYYGFVGTWVGTYPPSEHIENKDNISLPTVCLYVLNTLDNNVKIDPNDPENIITKFFSSIKSQESPEQGVSVLKNMLLISSQHPKVLCEIVDYFTSLEKALRPDEPVTVYTISSMNFFTETLKTSYGGMGSLYNLINSYGKHIFIDLSLAITAIELFKRRKLVNIYGSELKELKGIGLNLLNHHDKKIKISCKNLETLYVPKVKIDDSLFKNITEFLKSESSEGYIKRLLPLIPRFNYRLYDKLENFYIRSSELSSYNVLIIREIKNLSFKNLLYISIFNWNLIFIETTSETYETQLETYETQSLTASLYNQLSNIYNDKTLLISRNELKKLNPDYSLLRTEEEYDRFNSSKIFVTDLKSMKSSHILIDKYDDIKSYLKKLETSLNVDKIQMKVLEL